MLCNRPPQRAVPRFLAAALLTAPLTAAAGGFGEPATGYQLFSFGGTSIQNTQPDGAVASGGPFTAYNASIGSGLSGSGSVISAAGRVHLSSGTYQNGDIYAGGGADIEPHAHLHRARLRERPPAIDFRSAADRFAALSAELAGRPATGETFVFPWGGVELRGLVDGMNVFVLTEAQYERSNGIAVPDFDPQRHTVIVNVRGADIVRGYNGSVFVDRINADTTYERLADNGDLSRHRRLLWNFPDATRLVSRNSIHGAVLAPHARLTHENGRLIGQAVVAELDLKNAARLADANFTGRLTDETTVFYTYD